MDVELAEIKHLRKKYDLTQAELAKLSGVSQSLIAKIEAGRLDPTYTKAKKILDALHGFHETKEAKALDIMSRHIIEVQADERVSNVIKKMRKHSISQMPVYEKKHLIGLITENTILNAITESPNLTELTARQIMEDLPPTVPQDTPTHVIVNLLKYYTLVFVSKEGHVCGIITKADVLGNLYKK